MKVKRFCVQHIRTNIGTLVSCGRKATYKVRNKINNYTIILCEKCAKNYPDYMIVDIDFEETGK